MTRTRRMYGTVLVVNNADYVSTMQGGRQTMGGGFVAGKSARKGQLVGR